MSRVARKPRNSVQDRPGRLKLIARRVRRHGKIILSAGALVLVIAGTVAIARSSMPGGFIAGLRDDLNRATGRAGLRVERIVIEGRANTPEPVLNAAIGIARGEPILAVPLDATRTRIEGLTWVQSARVERRLPGTIVVNLTERRPFAIWQFQGKFRLVDRAGQVVDQDLAEVKELPLIVGAGAPAAAAPLLDLVGKYPALLSRMVAAVRVGERRWNLRLNTGADVMLPEGAEPAAVERLMTLHQGQALLDRPLKAVDMRLPDRLVVRPVVEPKPDDATRGAAPRKPT